MCGALCCAAQCLCCTCGTCCKCADTSSGSKAIYMLIMAFGAVVGLVMRYWGHEFVFDLYSFEAGCTKDRCLGVQGVYRASFSLTVFFGVLAALSACWPSINRGGWGIKFLLYIVLLVLAFLIPNDFYTDAYSWVSRVGSLVFLLLQMGILLDFAFDLNEYWMKRGGEVNEEYDRRGYEAGLCQNKWHLMYIGFSGVCIVGPLIALGFLFRLFNDCDLPIFFNSFTLIQGLIIIVLGLHTTIGRGLLPSAVVFAHSVFLVWGALTSNPNESCNDFANDDDLSRVIVGLIITALTVCWASVRAASSAYFFFLHPDSETEQHTNPVHPDAKTQRDQENLERMVTGQAPLPGDNGAAATGVPKTTFETESGNATETVDREKLAEDHSPIDRNCWVFHVVMALGGLYLGMLLTNWGTAKDDGNPSSNPEESKLSMWVKIISQWLISILYIWILVAPSLFPNRDFSAHNQFGSRRA